MLKKIYSPLQKLDEFLRTSMPWLWQTKIHEHLYLSILLVALSWLFCAVMPNHILNPISRRDIEEVFAWMFIPAVVLFAFFVYRMAQFNIHKRNGKYFFYQEFFEFIIFFISVLLCVLLPYSVATTLNYRVSNLISDEKLVEYEISMEFADYYFPCTWYHFDYFENVSEYQRFIEDALDRHGPWNEEELLSERSRKRMSEDEVDKVFNHLDTYEYHRPKLYYAIEYSYYCSLKYGEIFDDYYGVSISEVEKQRRIESMERKIALNLNQDDEVTRTHIDNIVQIINEFSGKNVDGEKVFDDFKNHRYRLSYAYENNNVVYEVNDKLNNINTAKNWNFFMFRSQSLFIFVLVSFFIALFYYIFKNVHWKQMLLGIVVPAIVLSILGMLLASFRADEEVVLPLFLSIFITAMISTTTIIWAKRYHKWHGIVSVFTNILLPVFFVYAVFSFDELHLIDHENVYKLLNPFFGGEYISTSDTVALCFIYGVIFYIFVGNSYMKFIYRKMHFLPRKS